MILPKIRENLLVQDLTDEVLIYDQTTNKSYCLNSTARTVFNHCDGVKTFADLNLPEDIIYLSLDELRKNNLVENDYDSPFAGMNRREVIRKVGLASMVALPLITGISAPLPTSAASRDRAIYSFCTEPSLTSAECDTGFCANTTTSTAEPDGTTTSVSPSGNIRCCVRFSSGRAKESNSTYYRAGACIFNSFCCKGTGTQSAATNAQGNYLCICD